MRPAFLFHVKHNSFPGDSLRTESAMFHVKHDGCRKAITRMPL
ncbi:hypothetical protein CBM2626_A260151 [Cupriavidus taiwanensis]|uniref:Uncharacterized protein n=1 Tax=Cupriavidus taiwanensis TaxID=164546 RepID=A0A375E2C6_9BURK|nr:hypothetical protein CBM2615_A380092 [Cupriavidus taiwanensis]SOZ59531.1 hypothetical protein CBM2614_A350092 [Cupriavidus taiwanensis]SOZ62640.1 hypothetical protein CBM2613_A330122 [Cupriavidus taiwanensis]SOZ99387.1 hypothetical protein CBM2626_A260151 [Cupriavidus taiwanensis]SPA06280.1 hypothetical protein CBM2625_A280120 [Cupriavidus taiwanensis]